MKNSKNDRRQQVRRLVRERAEVAGQILRKERSWDQRGIASTRAKLARIDAEILSLNPEVDVKDIRPLRLPLPVHTADTRGFSDKLLSLLIETGGQPISGAKLREQMQERFGIPHDTSAQRKLTSEQIFFRLHVWEKKGAVKRIPRENGVSNLWIWVGL